MEIDENANPFQHPPPVIAPERRRDEFKSARSDCDSTVCGTASKTAFSNAASLPPRPKQPTLPSPASPESLPSPPSSKRKSDVQTTLLLQQRGDVPLNAVSSEKVLPRRTESPMSDEQQQPVMGERAILRILNSANIKMITRLKGVGRKRAEQVMCASPQRANMPTCGIDSRVCRREWKYTRGR